MAVYTCIADWWSKNVQRSLYLQYTYEATLSQAVMLKIMNLKVVLPIAELARIAELAWASSDTELAHKIAQLAELAQASSGFWKMVAELAELGSSATLISQERLVPLP